MHVEGEHKFLVAKLSSTLDVLEHLLVERSFVSSLPFKVVGNDVERSWGQMVVIVVTGVWVSISFNLS